MYLLESCYKDVRGRRPIKTSDSRGETPESERSKEVILWLRKEDAAPGELVQMNFQGKKYSVCYHFRTAGRVQSSLAVSPKFRKCDPTDEDLRKAQETLQALGVTDRIKRKCPVREQTGEWLTDLPVSEQMPLGVYLFYPDGRIPSTLLKWGTPTRGSRRRWVTHLIEHAPAEVVDQFVRRENLTEEGGAHA